MEEPREQGLGGQGMSWREALLPDSFWGSSPPPVTPAPVGGAEAGALARVGPRTLIVVRWAGMDAEVTLRLRGFRHF